MYIKYLAISFFQVTVTRLIGLLLRLLGKQRAVQPLSFDPHTRYLFVANHQSIIDPFAIGTFLTHRQQWAISPCRFMTAAGIFYSYLWPALVLMGCYPTKKRNPASYSAVADSIYFLEHGQNVFIFPEGRRSLRSESYAHRGVKRIIDGVGVPLEVILIHLEWEREGWRRHLTIKYGTPKNLDSAQSVMDQIYDL